MCSTCCALGAVGMYCVQQFVFVRVVANRQCGGDWDGMENYIVKKFKEQ